VSTDGAASIGVQCQRIPSCVMMLPEGLPMECWGLLVQV